MGVRGGSQLSVTLVTVALTTVTLRGGDDTEGTGSKYNKVHA